MSSLPIFLGLDYHQDSVQVGVLDGQGKRLTNRSVDNDAAVIERVATRHGRPSRTAADAVVAKLMSLAGVGLVTAVTLRAEVGRFERFDTGKQLARFCGVTPRNASSGQRQADAGLIQPRRSPTARRADRIGPSADQHADWPLGEARRRHAPAGQAQERGRGRSRQSLGPLAAP
jgi:transposase